MGKGAERAPVELLAPQLLQFQPKRAHNFSAGAAMFDTDVLSYMQDNFLSYEGSGMGLFVSIIAQIAATDCLHRQCSNASSIHLTCEGCVDAGNESAGSWRACTSLHRTYREKPSATFRHS